MTIVYEKLLALKIPEVEHSYGPKDCMLYALGVGLGHDPMDEEQLAFVYEKNLKALPTMAVVHRAIRGFWVQESRHRHRLGQGRGTANMASRCTSRSCRHGTVIGHTRVIEVIDKGAGQGRADLFRAQPSTTRRPANCSRHRADHLLPRRRRIRRSAAGGAGRRIRSQSARPIDLRSSDAAGNGADLPAFSRPNPLHADPAVAQAAGFPRPILHGLATFGVAGHAILRSLCGYDPARLTAIAGRFSAPGNVAGRFAPRRMPRGPPPPKVQVRAGSDTKRPPAPPPGPRAAGLGSADSR